MTRNLKEQVVVAEGAAVVRLANRDRRRRDARRKHERIGAGLGFGNRDGGARTPCVQHVSVVARAAAHQLAIDQGIVAIATLQRVDARATVDAVVVVVAEQRVIAVAAVDRVGPQAAIAQVVACAAVDQIVAGFAGQDVCVGRTQQGVVSVTPHQRVGACATVQQVVTTHAADGVVSTQ